MLLIICVAIFQLTISLMHIGTPQLISFGNNRLWLVLSNALDTPKDVENIGVSLLT